MTILTSESVSVLECALDQAGDDVERLAELVVWITKFRSDLATILHGAEERLHDAMGTTTLDLPPPIGRIERAWTGGTVKWDSEDLLKVLVHRAVDPGGTGEVPSAGVAIERVTKMVKDCVPITPSLGWRKTGLNSYLEREEIEQYVTKNGGRKTVKFVGK